MSFNEAAGEVGHGAYAINIKMLKSCPQLSFTKYTLGPVVHENPYHIPVIREKLTRHIASVFPDIMDELALAFSEFIPAKADGELLCPRDRCGIDCDIESLAVPAQILRPRVMQQEIPMYETTSNRIHISLLTTHGCKISWTNTSLHGSVQCMRLPVARRLGHGTTSRKP